jgi:hypothetical protein
MQPAPSQQRISKALPGPTRPFPKDGTASWPVEGTPRIPSGEMQPTSQTPSQGRRRAWRALPLDFIFHPGLFFGFLEPLGMPAHHELPARELRAGGGHMLANRCRCTSRCASGPIAPPAWPTHAPAKKRPEAQTPGGCCGIRAATHRCTECCCAEAAPPAQASRRCAPDWS